MESPRTNDATVRWLWRGVFVPVWWACLAVIQLLTVYNVNLTHAGAWAVAGGVVACGVAWLLARLVLDRGAPASIWASFLLASVPVMISLVSIFTSGAPSPLHWLDMADPAWAFGILILAVGPTLVVFFVSRRYRIRAVTTAGPTTAAG